MKLVFEFEVSDGAIDRSTETELVCSVKEQAVLRLYSEQRITTGEAAEMPGLTRLERLDLLRRTGIGFLVELDEEDFEQLRSWRKHHATKNSQ